MKSFWVSGWVAHTLCSIYVLSTTEMICCLSYIHSELLYLRALPLVSYLEYIEMYYILLFESTTFLGIYAYAVRTVPWLTVEINVWFQIFHCAAFLQCSLFTHQCKTNFISLVTYDIKGSVAEMAERQPPSGETGVRSLPAAPSRCHVWPCDFGPKQFGWSINQLGEP